MPVRIGYDIILSLVPQGGRVLDLGCGDGALMEMLAREKGAVCSGVEISEDGVGRCVEKGLYCYQGDIDEGLSDYRDNSFDCVILNQTLQNTKRPENVLKEIMRIGRIAIVSFPNYGHLSTRLQLLFMGKMPKNDLLPFDWYESPDIHHLTIKDFGLYCVRIGYKVDRTRHFRIRTGKSVLVNILPNLFAHYGLFVLNGEKYSKERGGDKK